MPPIAPAPTVAFNDGTQIPQLGFGVFMIDAADTEALVSTALAAGTSTPPRPTATSPRVGKAIRAPRPARLRHDQVLQPYRGSGCRARSGAHQPGRRADLGRRGWTAS